MNAEVARFWAKVDKRSDDECWPWTASCDKSGHPVFHLDGGRKLRAHRYSLQLHLGRALRQGALACHRCNNPSCVNPAHLYEGTHASNARDKVLADRQMRGSASPSTRLIEADVAEIVARYRSGGVSQAALAAEYQVSQSEVSRMVNGKSWKHVTAVAA